MKLKALFPNLPNPDIHDLDDFKVEAFKLVSMLNLNRTGFVGDFFI